MSQSAVSGRVLADVTDNIAWVTMSNPAKRNALSTSMMASLDVILRGLDGDSTVKVIVVRGEGTEAFAAGADISEFEGQQASAQARRLAEDTVASLFGGLATLSTPLIAMINGHCIGAGMAVALAADLRIATKDARFSIPAARLGIGYPVALVRALVHTVGPAHAADLLFTGRAMSACEADTTGLVNRVVAGADLETECLALASVIAANAPLSIRAAKAAIRSTGQPDRLNQAEELTRACINSADAVEGQRAFMQKRSPKFIGA